MSERSSLPSFPRRSAGNFLVQCPGTMSPLARLVGLVLREPPAPYLSVNEIALLANASEARVRRAIAELVASGFDAEYGR